MAAAERRGQIVSTTAFLIALIAALLCLLSVVIAAHPGTREGPIINFGLGAQALGLIGLSVTMIDVSTAVADHPIISRILPALLLVLCGASVLIIGIALRIMRSPVARAVASELTGFSDFDTGAGGITPRRKK
jgi:hypothetical protein